MGEIVDFERENKKFYYAEILSIINTLDDYDIDICVNPVDVVIILDELYELYKLKEISYKFLEDMILYFNEICVEVSEGEAPLTNEELFNGLIGSYDLYNEVEISREEIMSCVNRAKIKVLGV